MPLSMAPDERREEGPAVEVLASRLSRDQPRPILILPGVPMVTLWHWQ